MKPTILGRIRPPTKIPNLDRKDKIEICLAVAQRLEGDDAVQAWRRLVRELEHLATPEAKLPKFNNLLHAVWIAASNDPT